MRAPDKSRNLTKVACNRAYNNSCMRRWMAIAAFGLLLTVPVWAQHGGGGHGGGGGGHAGGFGGGHSGGFSGHSSFSGGGHAGFSAPRSSSSSGFGAHSYSGPRSQAFSRGFVTAPSSRFSTRAGLSNRPFLHDSFRGPFRNGFNNFNRFRNFGFRSNCIGFGCRFFGNPWYAGYWDPWWWWNSDDSSYDQDYNDNLAEAAQMNQQSLEEQQMLRQEEADGDQDAYNQRVPRRHNSADQDPPEKDGAAFMPATVLIFRDQHRREVDNYAIVGQTVWVFAPRQAERIPLSDLDVAATVKANEDRGVTFRLPAANEGQ